MIGTVAAGDIGLEAEIMAAKNGTQRAMRSAARQLRGPYRGKHIAQLASARHFEASAGTGDGGAS
jgi:hypothetical protein